MEYSFMVFCNLEKVIFEIFNIFENDITYVELSKVQVWYPSWQPDWKLGENSITHQHWLLPYCKF
jgi:hypothetical protein